MLALDLEAVAPPPNLPVRVGVSSLRLWLPCRVSPLDRCEHPPPPRDCSRSVGMLAPSEVTVPYRVFPVWGSAIAPRLPRRAALVPRPKSEHRGCAHRVSHPLDALLPPRPAGLIPSRSRVWGSPFEALLRGERRAGLSTRQDPPEVSDPLPIATTRANGLAWLRAPPLQGFAHPPQPASVVWVLHHTPLLLPPWASLPPRYARASFAGLSARFPSRALLTYRCGRARARCRR